MTNIEKIHVLSDVVLNINKRLGVDQRIYSEEECIEAAVEYLNVAKTISKGLRGKVDATALTEELIDVITSSYLALLRIGVSPEEVIDGILAKMEKTENWYRETYS